MKRRVRYILGNSADGQDILAFMDKRLPEGGLADQLRSKDTPLKKRMI